MNIARIIIVGLIFFSSTDGICQESIPTLPIFKTVCIVEKATGFNWRSGSWVQTNFKPGEKWLIQKINVPMNIQKTDRNYFPCTAEEKYTFAEGLTVAKTCYSVKRFGSPSITIMKNEMCTEHFQNNILKGIYCRLISFLPDGNFIMVPPSGEIGQYPEGGYKDSLVLSVGKCSKLDE